ncbi:L-lactate dehydrogenase (cytochrome) [Thalassovita litoralis]|jgi:L-lactate dehydrogenase (cytochrome)|uniref:L-lactate dehydrogenase (Cytochrome) n=1 Tax=Thalassovita litoralis TaxID=1010611 RepID=A0A521BNN6_9RHOB|nr:L-lactate dehydrogenase [Thalassovita litoralis]SMO48725.1 L-lactate dehydrogenase (cytochrome) [Thalassovita litoralis]
MPTMNLVPASTEDYRRIAERKLPRFLFDYVDGGAFGETTLAKNTADFSKIVPQQRVMRDVSEVQTSTTLAGQETAMPLALAPVGMGGMLARRAEVQAKRAADAAGVPFTLSTVSICSLEEIAAVSDKPFWFQLYMLRDRDIVTEILDRAWGLGVRVLVFTVDLAVVGERYRDVRNGIAGGASAWGRILSGPLSYLSHPTWLMDVGFKGKPHTFGNLASYVPAATNPTQYREWVGNQFDASVTWKDIEWLRSVWKGKLMIKGVLSAEDAAAAVGAGAESVIVSNHGGRQLDGVASSISVLPEVVARVGDAAEVLMDGGVRSGLDVFRARALGASGVLIGRSWAFAVAARGEAGVTGLLTAYRKEFQSAMALCGVTNVADITCHSIAQT